jgi:hypothetical protein
MTQTESEVIAMREMCEWRIRKLLTKEPSILESSAFARVARGLRRSDFNEVVTKLLAEGVVVRTKSEGYGANVLNLAQSQAAQQE